MGVQWKVGGWRGSRDEGGIGKIRETRILNHSRGFLGKHILRRQAAEWIQTWNWQCECVYAVSLKKGSDHLVGTGRAPNNIILSYKNTLTNRNIEKFNQHDNYFVNAILVFSTCTGLVRSKSSKFILLMRRVLKSRSEISALTPQIVTFQTYINLVLKRTLVFVIP